MSTTISIASEKFVDFLSVLSLLQNHCNDCDIVEGKIRQFSNDKHVIFSIDTSPTLQNNDICIAVVKQKVQLMEMFKHISNKDQSVNIDIEDSGYRISDGVSQIIFKKTMKQFLDNQYITDAEFASRIDLSTMPKMFEVKLDAYTMKKIKIAKDVYSTDKVFCIVKNNVADIVLKQGDEKTIIMQGINVAGIDNAEYDISCIPFSVVSSSEMTFSMYEADADRGLCICRFETVYKDYAIDMYTKVMNSDS